MHLCQSPAETAALGSRSVGPKEMFPKAVASPARDSWDLHSPHLSQTWGPPTPQAWLLLLAQYPAHAGLAISCHLLWQHMEYWMTLHRGTSTKAFSKNIGQTLLVRYGAQSVNWSDTLHVTTYFEICFRLFCTLLFLDASPPYNLSLLCVLIHLK